MTSHHHIGFATWSFLLLIFLCLMTTRVWAGANCTISREDNCKIDDGIAVCKTDNLTQTLETLPSCLSEVHIEITALPHGFENIIFPIQPLAPNLKNARVLHISASRTVYTSVTLDICKFKNIFRGLTKMENLTIQAIVQRCGKLTLKETIIQDMKSIKTLDMSRTRFLSTDFFVGLGGFPVTSLIMKHVQVLTSIQPEYNMYMQAVDITKLLCPIGNTLEVVDLSYNDIMVVTVNSSRVLCFTRLRVLDISNNMIFSAYASPSLSVMGFGQSYVAAFLTLFSVEYLFAGNQFGDFEDRNDKIWDVSVLPPVEIGEDTGYVPAKVDTSIGAMLAVLLKQYSAYDLFDSFIDYWTNYILYLADKCNVSIANGTPCAVRLIGEKSEDPCEYAACFFSTDHQFDLDFCKPKSEVETFSFIKQHCDFPLECDSFPLPGPPKIRYVDVHEYKTVGKNPHIFGDAIGVKTLCVFEQNQLQTLDVSNFFHSGYTANFTIIGLNKTTSFNASANGLAFGDVQRILINLPGLKIVNISHTQVSSDGSCPQNLFQNNHYLKEVDMSETSIVHIPYETFANLTYLERLHLDNNPLMEINFSIIDTNLIELSLRNLKIMMISREMREQLTRLSEKQNITIDLSENPLSCDCHNLELAEWIQNASSKITFKNAASYICYSENKGYAIKTLNIESRKKACKADTDVIIATVFGTLAAVLLIMLPIIIYKRRWAIRHSIFVMRERYSKLNTNVIYTDYKYDAFIIYSSEETDRKWVHFTLVKKLEDEFKLKLCIHHRDFLGGVDIATNIQNAIKQSRKVVAIMSPSFLASFWCKTEMQMTHVWELKKLCIVMFEDVDMIVDIPDHISFLLSSQTFIKWNTDENDNIPETLFWKKLNRVMYT